MKTILIAYYWYPWNNSGTLRWLRLIQYLNMNIDVMTSSYPVKSFIDQSLPKIECKVMRYGKKKMPAVLWGLIYPFRILFSKYNNIIITAPPESLIIWAYIFQLFGKNVVLDLRDSIDRKHMHLKILKPLYKFFYIRIKNVVVCMRFLDESKPVVYHGYEDITKPKIHKMCFKDYHRMTFYKYHKLLSEGYYPDLSSKPNGYSSSCIHTLKHLGLPINNKYLNKEVFELIPISWEESANQMEVILKKCFNF